jgi:hypothetical protein
MYWSYTYFLLFSLSFVVYPTGLNAQKTDWKLSKEEDGVRVYSREVANTNYKEVRSITTIATSAEALLKIVNDYSRIEPWRFKVGEMKLLEGDPMGAHYLYFVLNLPIPFSDRDFILDVETKNQADGSIMIDFNAVSDKLPEKKGKVRMNMMKGFWKLSPKGANATEVTYQYLSDPGGVPAWIVNLFSINAPYQALAELRKAVEKP